SDLACHKAAASLQDAWRVLIAWQPARDRPDIKLGQLRAWSRDLHVLFAAPVREGSAGRSLDPKASAEARNIESRVAGPPGGDIPAGSNARNSFLRAYVMSAAYI